MSRTGRFAFLALFVVPVAVAAAPSPLTLADVAGDYRECADNTLAVRADGTVGWHAQRATVGGGDIVNVYSGTGTARLDDHWLRVRIDPDTVRELSSQPVPAKLPASVLDRRFHVAKTSAGTFLLDERALVSLVNHANAFYPRVQPNVLCNLRSKDGDPPGRISLFVPEEELLPPEYLARVLTRPLAGRLLAVTGVSQREVNVGGWMRPQVLETQYTGRLKVDLGARAGVFRGMRLYVGEPVAHDFVVEDVGPDHSEGTAVWITSAPTPGMPVSSAMVRSGR